MQVRSFALFNFFSFTTIVGAFFPPSTFPFSRSSTSSASSTTQTSDQRSWSCSCTACVWTSGTGQRASSVNFSSRSRIDRPRERVEHSSSKVILVQASSVFKQHFYFTGLLAIAFRQTNVVWVLFMALQAVGPNLMQAIYTKLHENQKVNCRTNFKHSQITIRIHTVFDEISSF